MESMPLSGQHAARAMKIRGFANLESVRRFTAFLPPAADILVAVATICLPLRGILAGHRGAAPYREAHRWQFAQTNKNFP